MVKDIKSVRKQWKHLFFSLTLHVCTNFRCILKVPHDARFTLCFPAVMWLTLVCQQTPQKCEKCILYSFLLTHLPESVFLNTQFWISSLCDVIDATPRSQILWPLKLRPTAVFVFVSCQTWQVQQQGSTFSIQIKYLKMALHGTFNCFM